MLANVDGRPLEMINLKAVNSLCLHRVDDGIMSPSNAFCLPHHALCTYDYTKTSW
jgi:hypothetical protein